MPAGAKLLRWIFVAACVAVSCAYAVFLQAPAAGIFHDDGVYLVTIKSLAEDRGYKLLSVPGEPSQTKYPILFPWLVSLVWRLQPSFPDNLLWLRSVPLLGAVAWFALSWHLLRRLGATKETASAAVLLTAASPWVVFLSTSILSETVFAALLTAALIVIVKIYRREATRFDGLIAGILMAGAVLTRTAGVAPAAAGLVMLAWLRDWRACIQYTFGLMTVTLPWFWWAAQHASETASDPYYSISVYGSWNILASYSWYDKLIVLRTNLIYSGVALGVFWGLGPESWVGIGIAALCSALVVRGGWSARWAPVTVVTAAYVALTLLWLWPTIRFLVPVMPLLVWLAWLGAGKSRRVGGALALTVLAAAGQQLWRLALDVREKGTTWHAAGYGYDWHALSAQVDWIARETPTAAVVAGHFDPIYYLYTGRMAVRAFTPDPLLLFYNFDRYAGNPLGTSEALRQRLLNAKVDYLVLTPLDGHLVPLVTELTKFNPGALSAAAGTDMSDYVIYRVDRNRLGFAAR